MGWSNRLLDSLSAADLDLLKSKLSREELRAGACLVSRGEDVETSYFPINSIISVITTMASGASVESRTIGKESGFGLLHALGSRYSYEHVEVQVSGEAWRISTTELDHAAAKSPSLVKAIVQHTQITLAQSAQTTACNALHDARARLCRWLLMTRDRLSADIVPLTQEHLSIMLGVQRTTVTALASELQSRGLIRYSRGRINLLNPDEIHRCACECYQAVERDVVELSSP